MFSLLLSTLLQPLSHISIFFSPSSSPLPISVPFLCPPALYSSGLLSSSFLFLCPVSCSPLVSKDLCFTLSFYAESCHMHVWTCQGGALMWCWHMHISFLCTRHRQRRGGERLTEGRGGQDRVRRRTSSDRAVGCARAVCSLTAVIIIGIWKGAVSGASVACLQQFKKKW